MKKMWLSVFVAMLLVTSARVAEARGGGTSSGVLFDVNLYYGSSATNLKTTGTETKSENKTVLYDIKLGSLSGSGFYWGGLYSSRTTSVLNANGENGSAMGASIGYFGAAGFFIMGHYLVSATYGEYKEGSGIQADLGYKFDIGSGWLLGGELSYRNITYKKNDTVANLESYNVADVLPMLSVGYVF